MSRKPLVVMMDQGIDKRPVLVPLHRVKGRAHWKVTPCVGCGRPARGGRCMAPECREAGR